MEKAKRGIIERTHAEQVLELTKVLLRLAEYCHTEPAKKLCFNLQPYLSQSDVEIELERLEKLNKNFEPVLFYAPFEPGTLYDLVNRYVFLTIENLCDLKNFIVHVNALRKKFAESKLKEFFTGLGNYTEISDLIIAKIDDERRVRDQASPELLRIRNRKKYLRDLIQKTLKDIISRREYIFSDHTIVERNGRQVLPVKSQYKKELPGIIHSYSNSGETVFIEPMEITDYTAEISELDNLEKDEIERILIFLTNAIKPRVDELENDLKRIVHLDLLFAKAHYAGECHGVRPGFKDFLDFRNAYHPLLKNIKQNAVPLNLTLQPSQKVLLISGPNAGGKTVVLKTVGLLVLMAQCGLFIPADEGTGFPFFNRIFADIGDEQSLESDLSTFAAHIWQIVQALRSGTDRNLVLLDELMNQTSVEEGSALAAAIMEEFSRRGDMLLATTHNENLKLFVSQKDDMVNAGMEFADRPTYHLIVGIPQPSNAIYLARKMGMDAGITDRAFALLDQEKIKIDRLFADLSQKLAAAENERGQLQRLRTELNEKMADFEQKKKSLLDDVKKRYQQEIINSRRLVERLIKTSGKRPPEPAALQSAKKFYDQAVEKIEKEKMAYTPYFPAIGETVLIRDMKKVGQVLAEKHGKYKISLDKIVYWAKPVEIEPLDRPPQL